MRTALIWFAGILGVLALAAFALFLWASEPDRPLAGLQARYLANPSDMTTVLGTVLHVRDTGARDAPAVILIHGFGSSLHTWEDWAQGLEGDLRVIRFDMPGSGLSPPDATRDYSDARVVALLAALMDDRDLRSASVLGSSLGGRIAWRFAAAHPERVDRLVLMAPDGFASPGFDYGKAPRVPFAMELLRFVLPEGLFRANLEPAFADKATLTEPLFRRYYDLMLAPGARGALLERMRQTVLVPPEPFLSQITAPVLLLWGDKDALIPVANAQDYLAALPDAQLVVLPGVGHVPQEEAPEASLAPVRAFLSP